MGELWRKRLIRQRFELQCWRWKIGFWPRRRRSHPRRFQPPLGRRQRRRYGLARGCLPKKRPVTPLRFECRHLWQCNALRGRDIPEGPRPMWWRPMPARGFGWPPGSSNLPTPRSMHPECGPPRSPTVFPLSACDVNHCRPLVCGAVFPCDGVTAIVGL